MGEVLARYENHVSIDKTVVDAWGIPALHIQTRYTDNEFNMARDAVDTAVALAESAGFEVLTKNYDPNPPGYSIHELGTCRMGDDPKNERAEQVEPEPRHQESVRGGWQRVCELRMAEPNDDHSGARHAVLRVSGRADAHGQRY